MSRARLARLDLGAPSRAPLDVERQRPAAGPRIRPIGVPSTPRQKLCVLADPAGWVDPPDCDFGIEQEYQLPLWRRRCPRVGIGWPAYRTTEPRDSTVRRDESSARRRVARRRSPSVGQRSYRCSTSSVSAAWPSCTGPAPGTTPGPAWRQGSHEGCRQKSGAATAVRGAGHGAPPPWKHPRGRRRRRRRQSSFRSTVAGVAGMERNLIAEPTQEVLDCIRTTTNIASSSTSASYDRTASRCRRPSSA